MDLDGCAALVTGGSGDLGSAIVRALGRAGVSVAVAYVGEQRQAERVAAEVTERGGRGWPVRHIASVDPWVPLSPAACPSRRDGGVVSHPEKLWSP